MMPIKKKQAIISYGKGAKESLFTVAISLYTVGWSIVRTRDCYLVEQVYIVVMKAMQICSVLFLSSSSIHTYFI